MGQAAMAVRNDRTAMGTSATAMRQGIEDAVAAIAHVCQSSHPMGTQTAIPLAVLLVNAQHALHLTQETFGDRFGASRRTVGRWQQAHARPLESVIEDIARAVHPVDAALARDLAKNAGESLESLGLAKPSPTAAVSLRHLVDTVVCAAGEGVDMPVRALRPVVRAAFVRAKAVGLSVDAVVDGLEEIAEPSPKTRAKRAKI